MLTKDLKLRLYIVVAAIVASGALTAGHSILATGARASNPEWLIILQIAVVSVICGIMTDMVIVAKLQSHENKEEFQWLLAVFAILAVPIICFIVMLRDSKEFPDVRGAAVAFGGLFSVAGLVLLRILFWLRYEREVLYIQLLINGARSVEPWSKDIAALINREFLHTLRSAQSWRRKIFFICYAFAERLSPLWACEQMEIDKIRDITEPDFRAGENERGAVTFVYRSIAAGIDRAQIHIKTKVKKISRHPKIIMLIISHPHNPVMHDDDKLLREEIGKRQTEGWQFEVFGLNMPGQTEEKDWTLFTELTGLDVDARAPINEIGKTESRKRTEFYQVLSIMKR